MKQKRQAYNIFCDFSALPQRRGIPKIDYWIILAPRIASKKYQESMLYIAKQI